MVMVMVVVLCFMFMFLDQDTPSCLLASGDLVCVLLVSDPLVIQLIIRCLVQLIDSYC